MQTAYLDQTILFKIKMFHDLIHSFRWPKKDFLSLLGLSEIFMLVLTIAVERYQYRGLPNQDSMTKH